jgi:holo-[acyl-carrier protein] synthase
MMKDEKMPILGIGNDIIEIERIRDGMDAHKERFLSKLFTAKEQDYCLTHQDPVPHFAGRFAAKEAIVKALGTGFGEHASWLDIEILADPNGKPVVHFSPKLEAKLQGTTVMVSISHCRSYASAFAIWVNTPS